MTKKNLEADGNILNSRTPDDTPYRDYIDNTTHSPRWEVEEQMPWQYKESSRRSKRYHADFREEFSLIGYYGTLITAGLLGLVMLILAANGLVTTIKYW